MPGTALVTINENQWLVEVAITTAELTTGLAGREILPKGRAKDILPSENMYTGLKDRR